MSEVAIRLDSSKPFAECRGERRTDDPCYRVHFWQGFKLAGGKTVSLPFDSQGLLVPDDGKTESFDSVNVEGKPVTHFPLYDADMRKLVESKRKKLTAAAPAPDDVVEDDGADSANADKPIGDDVNFVSWLRGEVKYQPHILRAAAKARFHKTYGSNIGEIVTDLVLDEKLVPEGDVCKDLQKFLPAKAA